MKYCKDNMTRINNNLFCDGYIHCPDGSDELEVDCQQCPRPIGYPGYNQLINN